VSWWADQGLNFKCTGCGKCCQNEGEVWMDPTEFSSVASYLNISIQSLLGGYTEKIDLGWAKMANSIDSVSGKQDKCIFLGDDRKTCTIYPVRPNQCRTYPWWPRLLVNESTWLAEAVIPDGALEGRKWTYEDAGCEGINSNEAVTVSPLVISRNTRLSTLYGSMLHTNQILKENEEKENFVTKAEIIQAVTKSTKGWVQDFIVKYDLLPFAESISPNKNIRHHVFMGNTRDEVINVIKYEALHLLTTPENETIATCIVLPFSFTGYEEFSEFSVKLDNVIIPSIEEYGRPSNKNLEYIDSDRELQV